MPQATCPARSWASPTLGWLYPPTQRSPSETYKGKRARKANKDFASQERNKGGKVERASAGVQDEGKKTGYSGRGTKEAKMVQTTDKCL